MAGKRREHAVYWWDQETGRFVTSPAYDAASPGGAVVSKLVTRFNKTRAGGHLPRRLGLAWRKMADPLFPAGNAGALGRAPSPPSRCGRSRSR